MALQRVLLVEDNEDHAALVRRHFERLSIQCNLTHCKDGQEALDYLSGLAADQTPSLILLDLRLPKVDGLDVLRRVREMKVFEQIPIVVLSTSGAPADVSRAYELHANSFVTKPADFEAFRDLMTHLGFYWIGYNRVAGASR